MRSRKTVDVEAVKLMANDMLAREDKYATYKFKAGVCTMIEGVLHASGNYNGFYFINPEARPNDEDYYARRYF